MLDEAQLERVNDVARANEADGLSAADWQRVMHAPVRLTGTQSCGLCTLPVKGTSVHYAEGPRTWAP